MKTFHDGKVILHAGDCLEHIKALPENSIDAVVTDPPYHLTSIVKRFGAEDAAPCKVGKTGAYARASRGFMGKVWDGGDIAFQPELWAEVLRVLKPGGHMVCFGGTRTYHRMVCAIEDAGFEIRDQLAWVYGSGFPKSHNVGNGWGTALKPAWEPICLARKPLSEATVAANVLRWGTGALNIDGCRIEAALGDKGEWPITNRRHDDVAYTLAPVLTDQAKGCWPANLCHDGSPEVMAGFPVLTSKSTASVDGRPHGTTFGGNKMSEDIKGTWFGDSGSAARFFASFPQEGNQCPSINGHASFAESSFVLSSKAAVSALSHVVEASTQRLVLHPQSYRARDMNVSALLFDGIGTLLTGTIQNIEKRFLRGLRLERLSLSDSHAKIVATPNPTGTITITISLLKSSGFVGAAMFDLTGTSLEAGASDSAKRFHYTSKADANDRLNSKHPTVKPVDLMQWLVRLVCPKGATVLDPFAGTGTTGAASFIEGRRCVLIEREAEYLADIERRMELLLSGRDERARKLAQAEPHETLPLFA
jgi:site-specific DNA-methyltransferase (adenine-specific)